MGLFRRRTSGGTLDPALTFMSEADARHLRALVRQAFAELGVEVSVLADHVRDDAGRQFGLWNVAATCHSDERGRRAWPKVVSKHVRQVLASMNAPDPFEELTPERAAATTYARLYEEASLPTLDDYPHREFAPGIVELLALDLPETVAVYPREHAERLGGVATLREHGLNNLRREPTGQLERLPGQGGGHFQLLLGDSVHTASRALLLPGLATELTGEAPSEHGWLLSLPNRHQLVWHTIRDLDVIPVLQGMFRFTVLGYGDAPGPLSPHVYWWDGSSYEQLTEIGEDGSLSVRIGPRFGDLLDHLAAPPQE